MSKIRIPARVPRSAARRFGALLAGAVLVTTAPPGTARTAAEPVPPGESAPAALHAFPDHVLRAPFLADPAEARLAGDALLNRSGVDARIGRIFPLVGLGGGDGPRGAQLSLEATAFLFLNRTRGNTFPLETFDGLVALPIDVASGPWLLRTSFAHRSAHLADGIRNRNAFTYSREWVEVTLARSWARNRVYGGIAELVHSSPVLPGTTLHWGLESEAFPAIRGSVHPYIAADFRSKEEGAWRVNQSIVVGARLGPGGSPAGLRVALVYFNGNSERGQLYDVAERTLGFHIAFDD